ncbi:MAG TPA: pantetheine-phosphate adenylyltransferase [Puia sp.]|jgi:pantetheine-phosphate adenylyltransferase|nr:pantetheine-phosphate adenylyltransferase [Puia sp.]
MKPSTAPRIALFPGTFDPITIGHQDIINRSLPLFDKLVIGIGRNVNKEPMFSVEQRIEWIREIYKDNPKVEAVVYEGLTVRCCQQVGARFILRGIRYVNDFEYEKAIADMNRSLDTDIETIFLTCLPQYTSVASTLVRDVLKNGGDVMQFLPDVVAKSLKKSLKNNKSPAKR